MTKKPFLVFGKPDVAEDNLLIVSLGFLGPLRSEKEVLSEGFLKISVVPIGIGVSVDFLELIFHEKAVLLLVPTEKLSSNPEDFEATRIDLDALLIKQRLTIIEPIELLIRDYSLDSVENRVCKAADLECFFDFGVIRPKFIKSSGPLKRVFNSRSHQKIKHFIRRG